VTWSGPILIPAPAASRAVDAPRWSSHRRVLPGNGVRDRLPDYLAHSPLWHQRCAADRAAGFRRDLDQPCAQHRYLGAPDRLRRSGGSRRNIVRSSHEIGGPDRALAIFPREARRRARAGCGNRAIDRHESGRDDIAFASWAYRRPVGAAVAARSPRFGRERGV
jgi:hypothetical protein